MTVDLDRLREAVSVMTGAPWFGSYCGKQQAIRTAGGATNVCFFPIADTNENVEANRANRAGIVALRNAAPSLLAELLAARGVVEACRNVGDCLDHAQNCCSDWCSGCQEALAAWATYRAALQAYDALNRSDAGKSEGAG